MTEPDEPQGARTSHDPDGPPRWWLEAEKLELPLADGTSSASQVESLITPGKRPKPVANDDEMETRRQQAELDRQRQDNKFASRYGNGLLLILGSQLVIADAAFLFYGFFNGWNIPSTSMDVWLGACVVEVIGIVLVIVRYLFPSQK